MGKVKVSLFGGLRNSFMDKVIIVEALILKDVIDAITLKYGGDFERHIYDEKNNLRRFINIYINGKDMRFLKLFDTLLNDGDEISIVPAVGGG